MRVDSIDPLVRLSLVCRLELELTIIAVECYREVMRFSLLGTFDNLAVVEVKVDGAFMVSFTIVI